MCWKPSSSREGLAVARLYLAAGRGLLLDVLATGDTDGVDAAMRILVEMVYARLAPDAGQR